MLTNSKFLLKTLSRSTKVRFAVNTPPEPKEQLGPEYDKREFDAFKHDYEKNKSHLGYTNEELFGKKYGLKHSPVILKEMKKDNYMLTLTLIGMFFFVVISRDRRYVENVAWNNYVHRDLNTVRAIPEHAKPK